MTPGWIQDRPYEGKTKVQTIMTNLKNILSDYPRSSSMSPQRLPTKTSQKDIIVTYFEVLHLYEEDNEHDLTKWHGALGALGWVLLRNAEIRRKRRQTLSHSPKVQTIILLDLREFALFVDGVLEGLYRGSIGDMEKLRFWGVLVWGSHFYSFFSTLNSPKAP